MLIYGRVMQSIVFTGIYWVMKCILTDTTVPTERRGTSTFKHIVETFQLR